VATIDDLFPAPAGSKKYMKFNEEGEALLLVQTGEPKLVPQKNQQGQNVWLVKFADADKYQPKGEGTFDPDDENVENAFQPDREIVIPVEVVGKKLKNGSKDDGFESFKTDWEVTKDQREKLKEALMDASSPAEEGTKYVVKLLSKQNKPFKYSVKVLEG